MQTLGQYRVGSSFNPSNNTTVDQIKTQAAALIDLINSLPVPEADAARPEVARLRSLAMTAIEDGAMWAAKAATKVAPL